MPDQGTNLSQGLSSLANAKAAKETYKREKLKVYLELGRCQSEEARRVPSTKLRGQKIARMYPDSQSLDDALRSNCTWLFEALHVPGHKANDLLDTLGVKSVFDLGYECPTSIRRRYAEIKKRKRC